MNNAEAEERLRNLKETFANYILKIEKQHGARILFNPVRFENDFDKFRNKIEEEIDGPC